MSSKVGTGEEPPVDNRLQSDSHPCCNNVSLVIACMVIDDLFD
jgi:hypothetical protein